MYKRFGKRLIDLVLSGCAILVLSPVLLLLVIAIKLDSPGPVVFKQKRVGLHKSHFNILKFRTMRIDTPGIVPPICWRIPSSGSPALAVSCGRPAWMSCPRSSISLQVICPSSAPVLLCGTSLT